MFKKIFSLLLLIAFVMLPLEFVGEQNNNVDISEFFRLHIRANSDSDEDQELKIKVRDEVLKYVSGLTRNCKSKTEAVTAIGDNIQNIIILSKKCITDANMDYPVNAKIRNEYFEYREYDGFYLPEGYYDSLIIEIGEGKGHNWWCVLYPAICLSGCNGEIESDLSKVPVELKISEKTTSDKPVFRFWIWDKLRALFTR